MSMDVVLEERGEEIVLFFEIESEGLDAQTFGNALITFDEIYRSINSIINPGLEIEVEFIRSDTGSIKSDSEDDQEGFSDAVGRSVRIDRVPFPTRASSERDHVR
jgi:hypothetical protein